MKRIYLYFISCIMVVTGLCTSCDAQLEQMNPNKATEDTLETISAMSFKPVILQIQMEILFHKGCFINSIMHCIERIQSCRSWKRSKENSERISSIR